MIDLEDVKQQLDAFDPENDERTARGLVRTREFLMEKHNPFDRTNYDPGHITASAIVLSPDFDSVVLVNHVQVGLWIQPGGHIEPSDPSLVDTACREVAEETGVTITPRDAPLVRVDVHEIPPFKGEPKHLHHDVTFGFLAPERRMDTTGDSEWIWCRIPDLLELGVEPNLVRSIRRARRLHQHRPAHDVR